jgi:hypothetical protein
MLSFVKNALPEVFAAVFPPVVVRVEFPVAVARGFPVAGPAENPGVLVRAVSLPVDPVVLPPGVPGWSRGLFS